MSTLHHTNDIVICLVENYCTEIEQNNKNIADEKTAVVALLFVLGLGEALCLQHDQGIHRFLLKFSTLLA